MSVKSVNQINKGLEKLSKHEEWMQVSSSAKQKLIEDLDTQIGEDLLWGEIDKAKKAEKKPRKPRRKKKTEEDGGCKSE